MKSILSLLLVFFLALAGCGSASPASGLPAAAKNRPAVESTELQFSPLPAGATLATLHTSEGDIKVALYPDYAPMACQNFTTLAQNGYYNATLFHRVQPGFVIQGGDASGTGTGGESIWGRPFYSELSPRLRHYAGALCMAASDAGPDTLLSQFYIVAAPADGLDEEALAALAASGASEAVVNSYRTAGGLPYLDYTDTVFGQVYEGMEVVDRIAAAAADETGKPKSPIRLNSITLEAAPAA